MILTYKVRHNRDFSLELAKARAIVAYALQNREHFDVKDLSQFGLKPNMAAAIFKKYANDKKTKSVDMSRVKIVVNGSRVRTDFDEDIIRIPVLGLKFPIDDRYPYFDKVSVVEVDAEYAYISVLVSEPNHRNISGFIGIDLNTAGHIAVAACPKTGKVWKFGKEAEHTYTKYENMAKRMAKSGNRRQHAMVKKRFVHKIMELCHQISNKLVQLAIDNKCGLKFEYLDGSMKESLKKPSFKYAMDSYLMYSIYQYTGYKAKLHGVPLEYVNPDGTSKTCSVCGMKGVRDKKSFRCLNIRCGHTDDSDVNAAFFIASRRSLCDSDTPEAKAASQLRIDRDIRKGSHDTPVSKGHGAGRAKAKKKDKKSKKRAKKSRELTRAKVSKGRRKGKKT